eukprot:TRINITY_DN633_c0_g1_i2.p1 TRINITY_DN633_c0_g1~~TRINITY_DN633_c0_g1_i2.p1  ORF type:complete len:566 (-),score=124.64 TRINITY_DN633_c0_g1_i2:119-1816(-)
MQEKIVEISLVDSAIEKAQSKHEKDIKCTDEAKATAKKSISGSKSVREMACECIKGNIAYVLTLNSGLTKLPASFFGKYLLSQAPGCADEAVRVLCCNPEMSQSLSKMLESMISEQEAKLFVFFESKKEDFRVFFFNATECLLTSVLKDKDELEVALTGTQTFGEGIDKLNNELQEQNIAFIGYLETLASIAHEICLEFFNEEKELEKKIKKEGRNEETNLVRHWNNFIRPALDINNHFQPVIGAMNSVARKIMENRLFPQFSIYRIFVGIFIKYYYKKFASKHKAILTRKLKEVNRYATNLYATKLDFKERQETPSTAKIDKLGGKEHTYEELNRRVKDVSEHVMMVVDMHLNELNAHYIELPLFFSLAESVSGLADLAKNVEDIFHAESCLIDEEVTMKPYKMEIMSKLFHLYKKIFPPCFLTGIKEHLDRVKQEACKAKIALHLDKLDEDLESESTLESKVLTSLVKEVCTDRGISLSSSELKALCQYIMKEEKEMVEELEMREMQSVMEEMEEEAAISRNEASCGKLTREMNAMFDMEGMPKEFQENFRLHDPQNEQYNAI